MPLAMRFGRASQSRLTRTTNVPSVTSFTACGVTQIVTNRGAGTNQSIFTGAQTFGTTLDVFFAWDNTASAGSMTLATFVATPAFVMFASRPAVGAWFEWYVRCSGTGTNLLQAGWRTPGGTWVTAVNTLDTGAAFATMAIATNGFATDYADMRVGAYREFNRVLTTPEVEMELVYATPFNTGGVTSSLAVPSASDLSLYDRLGVGTRWLDYSGLGQNWAQTGTIDTDLTAVLQFAPQRFRRRLGYVAPAPVGGSFQSAWARNANTVLYGPVAA